MEGGVEDLVEAIGDILLPAVDMTKTESKASTNSGTIVSIRFCYLIV